MKKKFKPGDGVFYFSGHKKVGYIMDVNGDSIHILFNDGSHGWHTNYENNYFQRAPADKRWGKRKFKKVINEGFTMKYIDNLTYIELMDSANKL